MAWAAPGSREAIAAAAEAHGGRGILVSAAHAAGDGNDVDVVVAHLPNSAVDGFIEEITGEVEDVHVSLLPQGVIALHPPPEEAPDEVLDVGARSPLEIVLSSLQSIGSLWSFLTYAGLAGAVVFVAFYTNTLFLLVGAMLISPMAEPAMNTAIATARGAGPQLFKSIARYFAAIATGAAVAAILTLLYGLDEPTTLMVDVSSPSLAALLLPVAAGLAGAVNIVSSERSSLVSGAGPGLLIAASLAPPMGLVGMAAVLGEPGILGASAFLLGLQLAGINLAAAALFRVCGVRAEGMRYARGRPAVQRAAAAVSLLAIAALVALQLQGSPNLRRESLERDAEIAARGAVSQVEGVRPVLIEARYAREDVEGQRTLLVTGFAQRREDTGENAAALEADVARAVADAIGRALPETTALVDVAVR